MNAQEALKNFFIAKKMFEDEVYNSMEVIEDFIDQSNAKPKTLEELGWEIAYFDKESVCCFKMTGELELSVELTLTYCSVNSFDEFLNQHGSLLSYEEILAIAEKMKELGMTGEQIAKGETK